MACDGMFAKCFAVPTKTTTIVYCWLNTKNLIKCHIMYDPESMMLLPLVDMFYCIICFIRCSIITFVELIHITQPPKQCLHPRI